MKKVNKEKIFLAILIASIFLLVVVVYIKNISNKEIARDNTNNIGNSTIGKETDNVKNDNNSNILDISKLDKVNTTIFQSSESPFKKITLSEIPENEKKIYPQISSYYINKNTGDRIFLIPNYDFQVRGIPNADYYLNGEKIVDGGAADIIDKCSSNGNYCIVLSSYISGGVEHKTMALFDLKNKKLAAIGIQPRDKNIIYSDLSEGEMAESIDFIDLYKWIDNNTLELTAFYILPMSGGFYRVSPKQIWQYNVLTKEYTLIKTIEDR